MPDYLKIQLSKGPQKFMCLDNQSSIRCIEPRKHLILYVTNRSSNLKNYFHVHYLKLKSSFNMKKN
ncbi:hypothetical protein T07_11867 [Trichinella nelsoni]|uniref:Uncharacterized protein n=1 Tax=Trichinella nelsoni TaxID=6336 RepID=A0A0V0RGB8_9BILA|nr:hypothetical protein T07_11867 [Trichinella nelsoni]